MRLPTPRGPLSEKLFVGLTDVEPNLDWPAPADDDDRQLALWALYELHHRGFDDVDAELEWEAGFLELRRALEGPFEAGLRRSTERIIAAAQHKGSSLVDQLQIIANRRGSGLPRFLERDATIDQFREFLKTRSLYHLKEADPHAWALPRIRGQAKAALAELLYDEYGDGSGARVHQELFAAALADAGLDPTYGEYVDQTPAHVLAVNNAMSLFGLHRRLRGAIVGHLAAFEMTSTGPSRRLARGAARLDLGPAVAAYYEEHVEADAVHEQLAARSICGSFVEAEPDLYDDVLFGAAACVLLDKASGVAMLNAWTTDEGAHADQPIGVSTGERKEST